MHTQCPTSQRVFPCEFISGAPRKSKLLVQISKSRGVTQWTPEHLSSQNNMGLMLPYKCLTDPHIPDSALSFRDRFDLFIYRWGGCRV